MKKIFLTLFCLLIILSPNFSSAAKISSVEFADIPEIVYPAVYVKNDEVSQKINDVIFNEVSRFVNSSTEEVTNGNFNSDSGVQLTADSLSEIGKEERGESAYSPKNVFRKLKAHVKREGIALFPDVKSLEKVPEDFYFDENLHVWFIFQQYDVAPYAAGIIEVDAG